jgi:hypothetical protein
MPDGDPFTGCTSTLMTKSTISWSASTSWLQTQLQQVWDNVIQAAVRLATSNTHSRVQIRDDPAHELLACNARVQSPSRSVNDVCRHDRDCDRLGDAFPEDLDRRGSIPP